MMNRYILVIAIFIITLFNINCRFAIADDSELYQFLSITDHYYVKCADDILISNDHACISTLKNLVAEKYVTIKGKQLKGSPINDMLAEYYSFWLSAMNALGNGSHNSDNAKANIDGIIKRKEKIQNMLK